MIADEYSYDSHYISMFGAIVICCGLIGSFAHAILLDKFKKYKYQLIFIGIASILSLTMIILIIDRNKVWLTAIALGLLGLSVVPCIGVGFSFCAEIAYPIGEAMSCGTMQVVSSIISTLLTLVFNFLLGKFNGFTALTFLGGVAVVGSIISLFVREMLNKTNMRYKFSCSSFSLALVPEIIEDDINEPKSVDDIMNKNSIYRDHSLERALLNKHRNAQTYHKMTE